MVAHTAPPLLDVQNVVVSFGERGPDHASNVAGGRFRAVDGVSFTIAKGTTVGLVGESGCGKTTLGRAIARFQRIESGRILLDGKDLSLLNGATMRRERCRMQMIFQNPFASLDPRMTVFDALAEAIVAADPRLKKERVSKAASHLEQVGLDPALMHKFPHEFSGGQRQRIAIARALAAKPSLVIADEPVSSLDVSAAAQVLNLLRGLRDRLQLTMLFISHDLAVVRFISHSIMVMYRGGIIEEGPAGEVFSNPRHPYTLLLLKALPVIPDSNTATPFFESITRRMAREPQGNGCSFAPRCAFMEEQCLHEVPLLQDFEGTAGHRCACFRAGRMDVMRSF